MATCASCHALRRQFQTRLFDLGNSNPLCNVKLSLRTAVGRLMGWLKGLLGQFRPRNPDGKGWKWLDGSSFHWHANQQNVGRRNNEVPSAWASWILLLVFFFFLTLLHLLAPLITFPSSRRFLVLSVASKLATAEKAFISAKEPALGSSGSVSLEHLSLIGKVDR